MPKYNPGDLLFWVHGPHGTEKVALNYLATVIGLRCFAKDDCYEFKYSPGFPVHGMWSETFIDENAIKITSPEQLKAIKILYSIK